jgi:putative FmdB family regulatory protein
MPIYEYKCNKCHRISEFLVGIGQGSGEIKCRHCGSSELERILSGSHVVMGKGGSGPYHGKTCCGREERCDAPPCSADGECTR